MPATTRSMRKIGVSLGLAVAAASLAPGLAARMRPANKTAFVTALDSTSNPITDLTKDDWGVREDGQNRKVVDAKLATDPLMIVVLVDMTRWVQSSVKDMRTALTTFTHAIQTGQPSASIAIIGFGTQAQTLVDLGKPAADVEKAIGKVVADQSSQSTVMLEAFMDAAKKLGQAPSARRAIVTLNSRGSTRESVQPQNVANAEVATRASLWAVSFKNARCPPREGMGGQNRDQILTPTSRARVAASRPVGTSSALEPQLQTQPGPASASSSPYGTRCRHPTLDAPDGRIGADARAAGALAAAALRRNRMAGWFATRPFSFFPREGAHAASHCSPDPGGRDRGRVPRLVRSSSQDASGPTDRARMRQPRRVSAPSSSTSSTSASRRSARRSFSA